MKFKYLCINIKNTTEMTMSINKTTQNVLGTANEVSAKSCLCFMRELKSH